MYRVRLTDAEQQELQRRAHQPAVKARTRDRLEMVRLSHAGWSVPQIARHLGVCEKRVRHWLKAFLRAGFDALPDRPHPGLPSALTPAKEEAIRERLRQEPRTWTAGQLAEWVAEHREVRLSPDRLTRRLKRARITYKRSSRSVKHKQKPEEVAAQKREMAAQEKKGDQGEIDVAHLDEVGFAPTLPTSYSWYPVRERLVIPYEAPQGRRVNAVGLYFSHGPAAGRLAYETAASLPANRAKKARATPAERAAAHGLRPEQVGSIDRERPLVIWLDNYSVHKSERIQAERPAFERAGITLCYLPSYSPQMSKIEPIWHPVKHHEIVRRSHPILGQLLEAVEEALAAKAAALLAAHSRTVHLLRQAAYPNFARITVPVSTSNQPSKEP